MGLRGWKRLSGTAERYKNPKGETVSRRQYDNARARQAGYSSYSAFQREKKSSSFKRYLGAAASSRDDFNRSEITLGRGGFIDKYNEARREGWETDPDSDFADFLAYTGLREPDWEWDIGDTDFNVTRQ